MSLKPTLILSLLLLTLTFTTSQSQDTPTFTSTDIPDSVNVVLFSESLKVAKATINMKGLISSLRTLVKSGTDLERYDIGQRGVLLTNVEFKTTDETSKLIFENIDASNWIIPYRFIRSSLDCSNDAFLGLSCTTYFKRGSKTEDFGTTLAFTFGIQAGLSEVMVRNVETVIELLTKAHKEMLSDKIKATDEAAKEFTYYNKLYSDAVDKRDFAAQIPELNRQLAAKNSELLNKENVFKNSKIDFETEQAAFDATRARLAVLTNEINSLTQRKTSLETEQATRNSAKRSFEERQALANDKKLDITEAIQVMLSAVDPNILNGLNCFNGNDFNNECLNALNRIN
jgi:hypothetical protein